MSAPTTDLSARAPSFRRDHVADGVTTYLRDLILTGQLRAGEHLRVEHLAKTLNISVTPVRESLLELLSEGYVEREAHRGYVVASITRAGFEDEVLVLAMIAGELAARAVDRASDEQMAELVRLQREIRAADRRKDKAAAENLNHKFHSTTNKLAASPKLAWMAERHSHYIPRITFESLDGQPSVCNHDHREILAATRAHDRDAARKAMADHMIKSGKALADFLESNGFWS